MSVCASAAGGAAGVAKAVQDKQANAETKRHNREIEKQLRGSGLRLGRKAHTKCCPTCKGSGLYLSAGQKARTTK